MEIGDSVKILNKENYHTDHNSTIPRKLMIHGIPTLYHEPNAKIVNTFGEYLIVNFTNGSSKEMQLGYLPKDLKLLKKSIPDTYEIY